MKSNTLANKNFHLPLPADMYARLRDASSRLGAPATELAREAIAEWLREEKRRVLRAGLAAFVDIHAGTEWDLDPAVEAAGIESISRLPAWDSGVTARRAVRGISSAGAHSKTHSKTRRAKTA